MNRNILGAIAYHQWWAQNKLKYEEEDRKEQESRATAEKAKNALGEKK
jgi:hypothetical protein